MASRRIVGVPQTQVRICGDMVELLTETVSRRVSLQDFITHLKADQSANATLTPSGELPTGCRAWCKKGDTQQMWVIEEKPRKRTLLIDRQGNQGQEFGQKPYQLALPGVVWVVMAEGTELKEPICYFTTGWQGGQTPLFQVLLANVGDHGACCLGRFRSPTTQPMHQRIEQMIAHFWGAPFNVDLAWRVEAAEAAGFRYSEWAAAGAVEYVWKFLPSTPYTTLADCCTRLGFAGTL